MAVRVLHAQLRIPILESIFLSVFGPVFTDLARNVHNVRFRSLDVKTRLGCFG